MKPFEVFAARWRAPRGRGARPISRRSGRSPLQRLLIATFLAVGIAAVLVQPNGQAAPGDGDALPYSKGFLLTGNYVVGSVDLTEQAHPIVDGFSTGTISLGNSVPEGADIIAAYLYWETITGTDDQASAAGVKFRGLDIDINSVLTSKSTAQPSEGAACFGSGSVTMHHFRADVLKLLPGLVDVNDNSTGKRLVNDADLAEQGLDPHTVTLPVRAGNNVPESAGAALVVVYRHLAEPLRKVVIYDGSSIKATLQAPLEQTLQGFYLSSSTKSAKLTPIMASTQPNDRERVEFIVWNAQGAPVTTPLATNPSFGGSSSQRAWAAPTYDVSSYMNPGSNFGAYGETVKMIVRHQPPQGGYDCFTLPAVIFSTAVKDEDGDGLPDGLEDTPGGLLDPDGAQLPDLHGMGASSDNQKDLFIEVNAMWAEPGTTYGSPDAPLSADVPVKVDDFGHHHMPTPEVLRMVGDAYFARGITVHFDVGDLEAYRSLGVVTHPRVLEEGQEPDWVDDYTSNVADGYLVASGYASGGEFIKETACDPANPKCRFPDYPGTVLWKVGLQFHRDAPVGDNGEELTTAAALDGWLAGGLQRRRFDLVRRGLFHYLLYAHARGKPKSPFPCLDGTEPTGYNPETGTCALPLTRNPEHHVPSSASGVADEGANAMVTLGLWEEFVGRPFVRAGTTLHELGHNLGLFHGGSAPVWGNKAQGRANAIEPNCKPNYLSSMSYLFQVHGLFDAFGEPHLNYSGTTHDPINESSLVDGPLFPAGIYRPYWFAPENSPLAQLLGGSPATRFCSGKFFGEGQPTTSMVRVHPPDDASWSIEWNSGSLDDDSNWIPASSGDVNFDGGSGELLGFNDWANIRLDQIGASRDAKRNADVFSGDFADAFGGDFADAFGGDFADTFGGDFADAFGGDFADTFGGDFADAFGGDFADAFGGDFADAFGGDFADAFGGDFADAFGGDFADAFGGDFADAFGGAELTVEAAQASGRATPHGFRARSIADSSSPLYHRHELTLRAPTFGSVSAYHYYRVTGATVTESSERIEVVGSPTAARTLVDPEELPNGIAFTYWGTAEFPTPPLFSGASNRSTVTAINEAPVANDDPAQEVAPYYTDQDTELTVPASEGVLFNDTDVDSTSIYAVPFTGSSQHGGTVVLNENGSFTYTPAAGFFGTDTFTYRANGGEWGDTGIPMSEDSEPATVTILVGQGEEPPPPPARYGFVNIENLPPPSGKTFKRGGTVPFKWRWTGPDGLSINTSQAGVHMLPYACSTAGKIPAGFPLGDYTPPSPGSGNSFTYDPAIDAWQFNWRLRYTFEGKEYELPAGTYVMGVRLDDTGQVDPAMTPCSVDGSLVGALITVK